MISEEVVLLNIAAGAFRGYARPSKFKMIHGKKKKTQRLFKALRLQNQFRIK